MGFFDKVPEIYEKVFLDYAERENMTPETAFANLMDFVQLKDEVFLDVTVVVENPKDYLVETEDMDAQSILQLYMDLFGEDSVGATVQGYYCPERMDAIFMHIFYDEAVPVWTLLEMFHYKVPGMDVEEDGGLIMTYIRDSFREMPEKLREMLRWIRDPEQTDDGYFRTGYYEPLYEDEEEWDDEDGSTGDDDGENQ